MRSVDKGFLGSDKTSNFEIFESDSFTRLLVKNCELKGSGTLNTYNAFAWDRAISDSDSVEGDYKMITCL